MIRKKEFGISLPLQTIETLNSLSAYSDFVELKLRKEVQMYNDLTEKHKAGNFFTRPKEIYGKDFVNLSRMALLNSIYAFTEYMLVETCLNHASFVGNEKEKFKDLDLEGNNDIYKAQYYLSSVDASHFEQYKTEFVLLNKCRLVRNKFAHNGGKAFNFESTIKYLENSLGKDSIKIEFDFIILGEKFCDGIIENNIKLSNGLADWAYGLEVAGPVMK